MECAPVIAKETVFAINGVNPSTDLDVVRAHTHTYSHTHTHTHGIMGNKSVFLLVKRGRRGDQFYPEGVKDT